MTTPIPGKQATWDHGSLFSQLMSSILPCYVTLAAHSLQEGGWCGGEEEEEGTKLSLKVTSAGYQRINYASNVDRDGSQS